MTETSKVNGLKTSVKYGKMGVQEAKDVLAQDPMGKRASTWGWLVRRERRGIPDVQLEE